MQELVHGPDWLDAHYHDIDPTSGMHDRPGSFASPLRPDLAETLQRHSMHCSCAKVLQRPVAQLGQLCTFLSLGIS